VRGDGVFFDFHYLPARPFDEGLFFEVSFCQVILIIFGDGGFVPVGRLSFFSSSVVG